MLPTSSFVFTGGDAFDGDNATDKKISARIEQVADELARFTKALRAEPGFRRSRRDNRAR